MWIKNYTASSVREALAGIKKEMGANAVILDTRVENGLTDRSTGSGARVTVTAASEHPGGKTPATRLKGPSPAEVEGPKALHLRGELAEVPVGGGEPNGATGSGGAGGEKDILTSIANIEQTVGELATSLGRSVFALPLEGWFAAPEVREWLNNERDLKASLTDTYAGYLLDQMPGPDPFLARDQLPGVVCFVGPPGCGKSTMLMKALALWWRTRESCLPVVEVTGEHSPVGGRLASWAEMFDFDHRRFRFEETSRLSRYLTSGSAGTVFVKCDLPAEDEGGQRLAKKVARVLQAKIVVLVLSSVVRLAVNERFLKRYAAWSPTHLSLSHWDDAQAYVDARHLSAVSRLPLAYYVSGNTPCGQIDPFTNAELRAGIATEICSNPDGDEQVKHPVAR